MPQLFFYLELQAPIHLSLNLKVKKLFLLL